MGKRSSLVQNRGLPWGLLLAGLILLTACGAPRGSYRDGWFRVMDIAYRVGEPPAPWTRESGLGVDLAFAHPAGSRLYADNSCNRYEDIPLRVLSQRLLMGFTDVEVQTEEVVNLDGRDAMRRSLAARLDGAPVGLRTTVLKKNSCVFDMILVEPVSSQGSAVSTYEAFVAGFQARERK